MPDFTRRVLLITLEPIARKMAGPAIRCLEIGKQIAQQHEVTVVSAQASDYESASELFEHRNFNLRCRPGKAELYRLAESHDIIFVQANVLKPYPGLASLGKYLVVDLYDPFLLSVLAQFKTDSRSASASYRLMHQVLKKHMITADFSLCASEKQRDYWLGRYCSLGRLSPEIYSLDPSFRKLIDVLPFGLPDKEPVKSGPGLKGQVPGINKDDFLLVWGGGIWEWFDPLTVIEAVGRVSVEFPHLKLYFMGYQSPNPQVGVMPMADRARDKAESLGLLNKHVFFAESWTAYEQRVNLLLDADAAVSAHFDLPETRFSFRTRILDYFWASLPILTTEGDHLAEQIQLKGAGLALPYQNVDAWAEAIARLIKEPVLLASFAENSKELGGCYRWGKAVEPLMRFCNDPYHLPAYKKVRMPGLLERAKAVYERGGKELIVRRSREIFQDLIRG